MNAVFEALLNGWWQGIVLTALVWLVMRDLPRVSAATRLAIWHLTLVVVLLLPVLQRIPLPKWPVIRSVSSVSEMRSTASVARVVQSSADVPAAPTLPAASALEAGSGTSILSRPVVEFSGHDFPAVLAVLAVALAFFQLLRLAIGYWVVRRLKRKAVAADLPMPVRHDRAVNLLVSERIGMPMAVGYRSPAILLPRRLVESLSAEEMHYVLLHESAHLRRNDDWMALAERIIRAIFFFQPAVYWIGRQIERERELACDDWVVAQSGEAKQYASSLARLAELGTQRAAPILATGAGRRKEIFARLETLLDRSRNRVTAVSEPLVLLAGLALLLLVTQGAPFGRLLGFSNFDNTWVESDGTHRREMKTRGEIEFTRDDQDVEHMSPGAMLIVSQSDGWNGRRVEIEADEQGVIHRRYYSGGIQRSFDGDGRRFLSTLLPQWVREQGRDIPERTARMIREKGLDSTIEDIRTIRRTDVKRQYLEEVLGVSQLNTDQLRRVLKIAGEMPSDGDKRQFFDNVHDRYRGRGLDAQVLALVDTIHSDDDRRHILTQAMELGVVNEPALGRLFQSAGQMNSDDDKTAVLMQAAQAAKQRLPDALFEAAGTIHSDDDRRRLLSMILSVQGDDAATVTRVLRTAVSMNSDEDKAKVLIASAAGFKGGEEMLREAGRVMSSIHSDGERRRCLEALIEADGKNAETLREVLRQALTINSDEDKSHVLLQAAGGPVNQENVRRAFFAAVNTIHSSGEQRRVLMAVLARPDADAETLREVSRSASSINSNEDQAAILKGLAERR